jgi:hypothetical protein
MNPKILSGIALSALVVAAPAMALEPNNSTHPKTEEPTKDAKTACMEMMQSSGTTDEGRKAMREFMESPEAPQAMNNMMEMAQRMGNGDLMLGMTKMMEMMGSSGSMRATG